MSTRTVGIFGARAGDIEPFVKARREDAAVLVFTGWRLRHSRREDRGAPVRLSGYAALRLADRLREVALEAIEREQTPRAPRRAGRARSVTR